MLEVTNMKDKSSDERFVYDQQILERERQMDDLSARKSTIFSLLENLENENRQWIQRMYDLENPSMSDKGEQEQLEEFTAKSDYINRLIENDREELSYQFSQSTNELEESRMVLQRERNELPWE